MEPVYERVESMEEPSIIKKTSKRIYLRKDISRVKKVLDGEEFYYWSYLEAKLTPEEYKVYAEKLSAENIIKSTQNSNNIAKLVKGQTIGDENQLAIMEALADLYDIIAAIGG